MLIFCDYACTGADVNQPYLHREPTRSTILTGDSINVDCDSVDGVFSEVVWERSGHDGLPHNVRVSFLFVFVLFYFAVRTS